MGRGAGPRPRPGLTARRARRPQGVREVPAAVLAEVSAAGDRREAALCASVRDDLRRELTDWAVAARSGAVLLRRPPSVA